MKTSKILNVLMAFLAVAGVATVASAKAKKHDGSYTRPYGMAGCGLGSMAFGRRGGQVFAATTNGTSYNQTFGISSETSNCVDDPNNDVASRADSYIIVNRVALNGDIARGSGETLAALANILQCGDTQGFGRELQRNYRFIFPSEKVYTNEITDSIINVIMHSDSLKTSCHNVKTSEA